MNRRSFLAGSVTAAAGSIGAGALAAPMAARASLTPNAQDAGAALAPFRLKYAPHFGMFAAHAGDDPIEQLKFAADQGFTAWEDNGMMDRSPQEQERIAGEMSRLKMTMGVFVSYAEWQNPTLTTSKPEVREMLVGRMRAAVEVAKRVNARWSTVVPGPVDPRVAPEYQTAYVIDNLRACCDVCQPAGLVLVLEPLNFRDHPNQYLTRVPQAYEICRAVSSPSCKILDDLYHQQISEGNLIPNFEAAWSEIAYFQVGDNPGRKEPGTGEINYRNVFARIRERGFAGIVGMEHGNAKPGKEGELALIQAYRDADSG